MGDNSKFVQDCDWQSEIPIEQTLEDVLHFGEIRPKFLNLV